VKNAKGKDTWSLVKARRQYTRVP